jgi:Tfp pilus assembly protein PilF
MSSQTSQRLWLRIILIPWYIGRIVFRWFRGAPRWMQLILAFGMIGFFSFSVYYVVQRTMKRQKAQAVRKQWDRFEQAVKGNQVEEMRQSLESLSKIEPNNTLAVSRLHAIDKLDADPTDDAMLHLTLRMALQKQSWPEAAREAEKRLKINPKDWLAHCVLALEKLQRGDVKGANEQLDKLPEPGDIAARVQPGGLLLSFRLYRALNRDTKLLRRFVEDHVTVIVRNPNFETLSAPEKLSIVESLLEGVDPKGERLSGNMIQSWAPVNNLLVGAADQALSSGDIQTAAQAARQTPKLDLLLRMLVRDKAMTAEAAEQASQELEKLTQKLWFEVQTQQPKNSEAYRGYALSFLRQNNYKAAREAVSRGLSEVGADPELLTLFSRMLQLEGKADSAYASLMEAAEKRPEQALNWWGLAAEAAVAANRRDLALEACQKMRRLAPKHSWAIRTEALLWLEADQPKKALELIEDLDRDTILKQPIVLRAYTKALVVADRIKDAEKLLAEAEANARKENKAVLALGVLIGWFEAALQLQKPEAGKMIADKADRLLELWPEETPLMRLRAEARNMVAEYSTPAWEAGRVSAAVIAVERVRAVLPDDVNLTLALAQLHLLGMNNPLQALRDVANLLAPNRLSQLTTNDLTLIGLILRRNQRNEDSLQVLELASNSREAKAGTFIQKALTLQVMGRNPEARRALQVAQPMPRTTQEQADYVAAAKLIVP